MKIGLYFGSFNPIHTGHCIIATYVANNTDLTQVWLVVSPQNPFKPSASLLNEYHRLHLAQLALDSTNNVNNIRVSDIEFNLPKPSYTIDTMTYLEEKYPSHEFSIVLGSDSLQNLHKWKNAEVLIKRYKFYVYKRPGIEVNNTSDARIQILDAPLLEISSTRIREMIKQGKSIRYLVPDEVRKEIELYNYYK